MMGKTPLLVVVVASLVFFVAVGFILPTSVHAAVASTQGSEERPPQHLPPLVQVNAYDLPYTYLMRDSSECHSSECHSSECHTDADSASSSARRSNGKSKFRVVYDSPLPPAEFVAALRMKQEKVDGCRKEEAVAAAQYNASRDKLGWDYLHLEAIVTGGNVTKDSEILDAYYHTGVLESIVFRSFFEKQYNLTGMVSGLPGPGRDWMVKQLDYLRQRTGSRIEGEPKFWTATRWYLGMLQGFADGLNYARVPPFNYTLFDVFVYNLGPEIGDIMQSVFGGEFEAKSPKLAQQLIRGGKDGLSSTGFGGHCTGFVRLSKSGEAFLGHATWGSYTSMSQRVFKVYDLPSIVSSSSAPVTKTRVSYSGYPLAIASFDDWYQTSNGLAVFETSFNIFNTSLYKLLKPTTVPEFMRSVVANQNAASGKEWAALFSTENSGTYNNQWCVLDFKKLSTNHEAKDRAPHDADADADATPWGEPGAFWVLDQVPGLIASADMTQTLNAEKYWGSYNIPFFKSTFDAAGYAKQVADGNSVMSWSDTARARIFRRNASMINTKEEMQRMMRFNHFKIDPLSLIPNCTGAVGPPKNTCVPSHSSQMAVGNRADLMPGPATKEKYGPLFAYVGPAKNFGAIDAKISSFDAAAFLKSKGKQHEEKEEAGPFMMTMQPPRVISGPSTDNGIPPFRWSTSPWPKLKPKYSVEEYNYNWLEYHVDRP